MLGPLFLNESETSENATAEHSGGKQTQPAQKTMGKVHCLRDSRDQPNSTFFSNRQ